MHINNSSMFPDFSVAFLKTLFAINFLQNIFHYQAHLASYISDTHRAMSLISDRIIEPQTKLKYLVL
jgi:hypothetical protein